MWEKREEEWHREKAARDRLMSEVRIFLDEVSPGSSYNPPHSSRPQPSLPRAEFFCLFDSFAQKCLTICPEISPVLLLKLSFS